MRQLFYESWLLTQQGYVAGVMLLFISFQDYIHFVNIYSCRLVFAVEFTVPSASVCFICFEYDLSPTVEDLHFKCQDTLTQELAWEEIVVYAISIWCKGVGNVDVTIFVHDHGFCSAAIKLGSYGQA